MPQPRTHLTMSLSNMPPALRDELRNFNRAIFQAEASGHSFFAHQLRGMLNQRLSALGQSGAAKPSPTHQNPATAFKRSAMPSPQ